MKRQFLICLFAGLSLVACQKNEKNSDQDTETTAVATTPVFEFELEAEAKNDDVFALYYTEDNTIDFKNDPIWIDIKGKAEAQDVEWKLPEDALPTQFRLDLGNKNPDGVVLKEVKLKYGDKERVLVGAEIGNFFRADESKCTFDPTTGLVKPKSSEAMSLYPHETVLKPEIDKLLQ